jgi:cytidyltransferase-like protein
MGVGGPLVTLAVLVPFWLRSGDGLLTDATLNGLGLTPALLLLLLSLLSAGLLAVSRRPHQAVLTSTAAMLLFAALKFQCDSTVVVPADLSCGGHGGKCVALVTGGNSGIGFATSAALAAAGHTVLLGCRSQPKCDAARAALPAADAARVVALGGLDLASLQSVKAFAAVGGPLAEALQGAGAGGAGGGVSLLVANAGLVPTAAAKTIEGFEVALGVNMGHQALVQWMDRAGLLAKEPPAAASAAGAAAATAATIVTVSSDAMWFGAFHDSLSAHPEGEGDLRAELTTGCGNVPLCAAPPALQCGSDAAAPPTLSFGAYARAKLSNLMLARELQRRYPYPRVAAAAVMPGMVNTPMASQMAPKLGPLDFIVAHVTALLLRPPEAAAAVVLRAAANAQADAAAGRGGGYYNARGERVDDGFLLAPARDRAAAQRLWEVTDRKLAEFENDDTGTPAAAAAGKLRKRVFVSGCFDLMHSGHVAFFKQASMHGDLYVSVGNDANIRQLKHHDPMFPEGERVYMAQSVRYVHRAFVARGMGHDQKADLAFAKADIFFVNEDGDKPEKRKVCEELGIQYLVEARLPDAGLPARSSSSIKRSLKGK